MSRKIFLICVGSIIFAVINSQAATAAGLPWPGYFDAMQNFFSGKFVVVLGSLALIGAMVGLAFAGSSEHPQIIKTVSMILFVILTALYAPAILGWLASLSVTSNLK